MTLSTKDRNMNRLVAFGLLVLYLTYTVGSVLFAVTIGILTVVGLVSTVISAVVAVGLLGGLVAFGAGIAGRDRLVRRGFDKMMAFPDEEEKK